MCAIKRRDHLYRKFKISQSVSAWKRYKEMRNRVVRSFRAGFFSNLSRTANDPQKFWKRVNTLNTVSSHIPTLVSDNTLVSEDAEKAEVLNVFFGQSYNKSDPPLQHSPSQHLSDTTSDISLIDISEEEVVCLISSLKPKKSPGIDGITVEMLQLVAQCIGPALTLLFNHFLAMGKIPSEWKVGKVIPIPKGKHLQLPPTIVQLCFYPLSTRF